MPDDETDGIEKERCIHLTSTQFHAGTLIHELAHLCGGPFDADDAIRHVATPFPPPSGKALENSKTGHDYVQMTPDEALRNTHSFQGFTQPAMPEIGPPTTIQW